jgi:hypothetical protein
VKNGKNGRAKTELIAQIKLSALGNAGSKSVFSSYSTISDQSATFAVANILCYVSN